MALTRIATYSIDGSTRYGAVTDGGIVDLSARFGKDYPTLREVVAAGALTRLGEAAACLLYTSPSPRDRTRSRMPSSA